MFEKSNSSSSPPLHQKFKYHSPYHFSPTADPLLTIFDYQDKKMQDQSSLEITSFISNDGLPRYLCPQCNVKYKSIGQVKNHLRDCGIGAQCPICSFVCTQSRNLRVHMATHDKQSVEYKRRQKQRRRRR